MTNNNMVNYCSYILVNQKTLLVKIVERSYYLVLLPSPISRTTNIFVNLKGHNALTLFITITPNDLPVSSLLKTLITYKTCYIYLNSLFLSEPTSTHTKLNNRPYHAKIKAIFRAQGMYVRITCKRGANIL